VPELLQTAIMLCAMFKLPRQNAMRYDEKLFANETLRPLGTRDYVVLFYE
jgi:hypothetical protein